jgi:two-component system response regulator
MNEPVEILLVEDNPNDVKLALHAFSRYKVQVVRDGEEALDFLFCRNGFSGRHITNCPKLVLLDLKLPKVDGLEVLRQVKSDSRTRMIPVVVLTSSDEEHDLVTSYELCANSYILKPVDFDQFLEVARTLGTYWLLMNRPAPASLPSDPLE